MSAARELMTINEVSEYLKVPVKTLRQWTWRQQIPSVKLNGVVRFDKGEIEAWIRQSSRGDGQ